MSVRAVIGGNECGGQSPAGMNVDVGAAESPSTGSAPAALDAAHGADPPGAVCNTGLLLRLRGPGLEREFWRAHTASGGLANDAAGCLFGMYFPATYLRGYLSAPDVWREHGSLARYCAPSAILLAAGLAQLSLLLVAPRAYRRRRFALHLVMRALRLGSHAWGTLLTGDSPLFWRVALMADDGTEQRRRAMAASLYVLPLTFLIMNLTNPCPVALQPLLGAVTLFVYARGWLPTCAWVWLHPRVAPATQALCSRLDMARVAGSSMALAAFGWPSPGPAAAASSPLPSPQRCACTLQKVSMALVLSAAIILPNAIGWWAEHRSKSQFLLRTRGMRLRVRALSDACARLEAAGLWPGASAVVLAAPSLAAAAALLLWHVSDGLVLSLGPGCS